METVDKITGCAVFKQNSGNFNIFFNILYDWQQDGHQRTVLRTAQEIVDHVLKIGQYVGFHLLQQIVSIGVMIVEGSPV